MRGCSCRRGGDDRRGRSESVVILQASGDAGQRASTGTSGIFTRDGMAGVL